MTTFEVGYKVSDGIWSINMIHVNSDSILQAAISTTREAAKHAAKYNYLDYYVSASPLVDWQIAERERKGMPSKLIEA